MTLNRRLTTALAATASVALVLGPTAAWADDEPLTPLESTNSIGQSLQVRVNADGTQNAQALNYRWAATQITVSGEPGTTVTVKSPENGKALHNLEKFGFIHQENGMGVYNIPIADNGVGVGRSVSLFPQDQALPMELKVEFTLDGQPITAEDLRGKSGQVTAKYSLINKSTQEMDVTIDSISGEEVTKKVQADVPWVAEASTLLPFRFAGLNAGHGAMLGADGRGNWLVKWIKLPFRPIAEDGIASFGWSANVENVQIPKMLIQASPVYIAPEDEQTAEEAAAEASAKAGVPPPNTSADKALVQDGLAQVIKGLDQLTADDGEDDGPTFVEKLPGWIEELNGVIEDLEDVDMEKLQQWSDAMTPGDAEALEELSKEVANLADWAMTIDDIPAYCAAPPTIDDDEGRPKACEEALTKLKSKDFQTAAAVFEKVGPALPGVDALLETLSSRLPLLEKRLISLRDTLVELQDGLPTVDEIVDGIISSPGGQDVQQGMAKINEGMGGIKSELSVWAGAMAVAIQSAAAEAKTAIESGKDAAAAAIEHLDTLSAEVHGLKLAAATSPLPFGGFPETAPAGTKLAGAYEFRIDAADAEHPSTLPRLLIALVLFIGGGFLLRGLAGRHAATVAVGGQLWSAPSIAGAHKFSHDTAATPVSPSHETSVLPPVEEDQP